MPRPRRLANGVKWRPPKPLEISRSKWASLERALGVKLSDETRTKILSLTNDYLEDAEKLRATGTIADVEVWLERAGLAATRLSKLFFSASMRIERQAANLGRAHIYGHLREMLKTSGRSHKIPIEDVITLLPSAIEMTRRHLDDLELAPIKGGDPWARWIANFQAHFEVEDLPSTSRHDLHLGPGFAKFVLTLQTYFPEPDRRHMPDLPDAPPDALAKAISRAVVVRDK